MTLAHWQDDEPSEGESKEGEKSGEAEGLDVFGTPFFEFVDLLMSVFFCEGHEGKLDFWKHFWQNEDDY